MDRSTKEAIGLSEQRKYRGWTAQQKITIVLVVLRRDRSVKDVCREHEISDTLFYSWRDKHAWATAVGEQPLRGLEHGNRRREGRHSSCRISCGISVV